MTDANDLQRSWDRPVINLSQWHWRARHGEIEAIGTWYGPAADPCMVLIRARDFGASVERSIPIIIPYGQSHVFSDFLGDEQEAIARVMRMLPALRMDTSFQNVVRVLGIIQDHLGDMLLIPVRPPTGDREAVGVAIRTDRESGKTTEMEITAGDV